MKRSIIGLTVWGVALAFVPAFAGGCSDASSAERDATGSVALRLTGTSASGKLYRLRNGVIKITGTATATVSTEDNVDAGSVSLELKAGAYLAKLNNGWSMERGVQTGGMTTFEPVKAVLTSMNPLPFTVADQQTTSVHFQFNAGDEAVELGNGTVVVDIDVNDCVGAAAADCDQDGDGVPVGVDCDDANPATFPGAPELCDGLDNDCDGVADDGCCDPGDPNCCDPSVPTCNADQDGDGFPAPHDCNDLNAHVFPNAEELCDSVDNDCDTVVDEGCGGSPCTLLPQSGCAAGLACYPIGAPSNPNPPLICITAGSGTEHMACSASDQCQPGLICSIAEGPQQCLIACDPSNPFMCPSGVCLLGPGLPVCQ